MLRQCLSTWCKLAEVNIALEINALLLQNRVAKIMYTLMTIFPIDGSYHEGQLLFFSMQVLEQIYESTKHHS